MADASIVFRISGPKANSLGTLAAITIDASVHEMHSQDAQVTEHPVESGANISDHVRPLPRVVTVDGYVTNTPPRDSSQPAYDGNRAQNFFALLSQIRREGTVCQILTSLEQYDSMVLKSFQAPRDSKTTEALAFSATFVEIATVDTQTILLPKATGAAAPKQKNGKQPGSPAPEPVKRSALKSITNAVFGVK